MSESPSCAPNDTARLMAGRFICLSSGIKPIQGP